jgi:hypothetical protein
MKVEMVVIEDRGIFENSPHIIISYYRFCQPEALSY